MSRTKIAKTLGSTANLGRADGEHATVAALLNSSLDIALKSIQGILTPVRSKEQQGANRCEAGSVQPQRPVETKLILATPRSPHRSRSDHRPERWEMPATRGMQAIPKAHLRSYRRRSGSRPSVLDFVARRDLRFVSPRLEPFDGLADRVRVDGITADRNYVAALANGFPVLSFLGISAASSWTITPSAEDAFCIGDKAAVRFGSPASSELLQKSVLFHTRAPRCVIIQHSAVKAGAQRTHPLWRINGFELPKVARLD